MDQPALHHLPLEGQRGRERRLLRAIEKATGKQIEKMELPSAEEVTDKRIGKFKQQITETLDVRELDVFRRVVEDYQREYGVPIIEVAAALGAMAQGKKPLVAKPASEKKEQAKKSQPPQRKDRKERKERPAGLPPRNSGEPDNGMERFRIEVGHEHGVKPGNIVGAIANEAEIDAEYIGRIDIHDDYSIVDLPEGMPKELFRHLKKVWVSGQRLQITRIETAGSPGGRGSKVKKARSRKKPAPSKGPKRR